MPKKPTDDKDELEPFKETVQKVMDASAEELCGPAELRKPSEWVPKVIRDGKPRTLACIRREAFQKYGVKLWSEDLFDYLEAECKKTHEEGRVKVLYSRRDAPESQIN